MSKINRLDKTFVQIARHWIVYDPRPTSLWIHICRKATFRDVGPYRVVIEDGKVIGHTLAGKFKGIKQS